MTIFEMSISGAAMIITFTLIRAVFLHKLPKKAFVLMWEIVIIRLLLPVKIPSIISAFTLTEELVPPVKIHPDPTTSDAVYVNGYPEASASQYTFDFSVGETIWLVGIVISAAVFVGLYILSFKKFRLAEHVNIALPEDIKLRRKVVIRLCGGITSPLTYGVAKPVILLPKTFDLSNASELEYVLTHEMYHIRRFDILRKVTVIIAVCVHWFDPLVWVMFVLFNRDIELVCDEAAIGKIGCENRKEYALAMIGLLDTKAGILQNYFSKNAIEERIISISKYKRTNVLSDAAAITLTLCVTVFFATSSVMGGWKKLDRISGFDRVFDSPITSVTLLTGDDTDRLINASGEPILTSWNEFLHALEVRETGGSGLENAKKIIIENEEETFEILVNGKNGDDDLNDSTLIINGVSYEYRSSVKMPYDKTLYPFGDKLDEYIFDIVYD